MIYNSPIVNMTERLGTLTNLNSLNLISCSLTELPNLSGVSRLSNVDLSENQLSKVDGLTGVEYLYLQIFTDIPTLNTPDSLLYLYMPNNPLKNMLKITSHVNLYYMNLGNTNLTSIPAIIDRLQNLDYLYLSDNKLFYLPTNMLKLTSLKTLDIQYNLFSPADIQAFQTQFNTTLPNMTFYY
jgi:Leucine-rich repeat (LRR) protein